MTWLLCTFLFTTVFLVVLSFYLYWTLTDNMGQTASYPLNFIFAHFKEVRTKVKKQSVDVKKGEIFTYCISEFLIFDIGWLLEVTFHLPTMSAVEGRQGVSKDSWTP